MTGNISLSYKGNTVEKTVTKDVEDDVDKPPNSDFFKASAIIFDKIDNGKDGVLPLSIFFDLIETLSEGFIVRIWRVIYGK